MTLLLKNSGYVIWAVFIVGSGGGEEMFQDNSRMTSL